MTTTLVGMLFIVLLGWWCMSDW